MKSALVKTNKWIASFIMLLVAIFLIAGCVPANQTPIITSLKAKYNTITTLSNCPIECVASDPDEDSLSYEWTASEGGISGDGPNATWKAPGKAGSYEIAVVVSDGHDGEARGTLTINVIVNHDPVIEELAAKYLKLKPGSKTTVKCIAQDADGDDLSYTWSASGGKIDGESAVVNWVAPDSHGIYDIAVTVGDGKGGEKQKSVEIKVGSG